MKSVIVYYSFSGNTRKAAEALKEYLEESSEVHMIELKATDESNSFFRQALRALVKTKANIEHVDTDLAGYDIVCIGSPVWAFGPAPAVNKYLKECNGLKGKQAIVFTTYGSGAGNRNCLEHMKRVLIGKGVKSCKDFTLQGARMDDKDYIISQINNHN
jgi:flavodoxin